MQNNKIPTFFKPILWSYDFSKINPKKDKKTIIVNSINYGDLKHWKWLSNAYGKTEISRILSKISVKELRNRARELAGIIFKVKQFNHAPRSS